MDVYEISADRKGAEALTRVVRPTPELGPGQVLVKIHAVSLNYRDLLVLHGTYGSRPKVPLSDGAGEVIAVASDVTRVKVGERVAGAFWQRHISGEQTAEGKKSGLGGELEGVLAEYIALDQQGLVSLPDYLTYEEAATLPCAAVTAWNALVVEGHIRTGDTVVLLGTGGVSIFALQLAKAAGARVIISSSSDEKLQRAALLGADFGINYKSTPQWDDEVLRITGGRGADIVLELGGAQTMNQSLRAVRVSGQVEVIGVINGVTAEINAAAILGKHIRVQGISVGSRDSFEQMLRALEAEQLHPIIDRVFQFDDAKEAIAYLESGEHFGKVVIRV